MGAKQKAAKPNYFPLFSTVFGHTDFLTGINYYVQTKLWPSAPSQLRSDSGKLSELIESKPNTALFTDEQGKAVDSDEDLLMAINDATARAAELQGDYWDALREIERLIGFYIKSTDELSDMTFTSIAEAKEHYSAFKEDV